MKNVLFLILTLALFCASCKKSGGGSGSSSTDSAPQASTGDDTDTPATDTPDSSDDDTSNDNVTKPTPEPEPEPEPAPPEPAFELETNIIFINQTEAQKTKFRKALEIIKLVVATDEFKSKVLNHTYGGRKTFVDNGGYSNSQIYQKILDGAETLQPTKDNEMDMELEMYYAATSTVGYTYPNSKRVWVNTKFFNQYTAAGVARNLMHEWLHKLGFKHASSYSTSRDYSVPYAIGDMIGELGKDYL